MKLLGVVFLALWGSFGLAQMKSFVGTYEGVRIIKGKPVDNKTLKPSEVIWLELHIEGNWVMRNTSGGFDGKWHVTNGKLVLITENGTGGKLKTPEKSILVPKPDRRRLVPISPKILVGQMEFRWAPNVKAELNARGAG